MGNATRWLDVEVGTDDIELNTLPSNLALVDLLSDNEIKLLIGDLGREDESKLKVFRGAMQISDILLPDLPLGVVGFYTSETMPRSIPVVAVAFSSSIYIYRNMKLFYKYYLPTIELSTSEMEVWKQLIDSQNQNLETINALTESLRMIPEKILSLQSKHFLSIPSDQQLEYLETITELPTRKVPEVTCIATLKLNSVDRYSVSCLIVGTEDGDVIVLDPQTFTQLSQAKICGTKRTPCQIVTTGLFNVDYRLTIATREKSVFLLKREWKEGRMMFNTDDHIVAIEVMTSDNSVIVICADNTMMCYNKKGKKQWCLSLEHRPVSMTLVPIIHLGLTLTAVGLASGHVHMYDGKVKRDTIFIRDVASIMKFGQLGQEEHVLVIITGGGNLMLKILKRTAEFGESAAGLEPTYTGTATHNTARPWLIPKKSKLFIEQSIRERENAVQMHSAFQVELTRVRLLCARALLAAHHSADHNVAAGVLRPIALTAEVEGLGPVFRVSLLVENTSNEKAVIGLSILFHAHTANYKVSNPHIKIPLLAPGSKLKFPTKIEEVFNEDTSPDIFFRSVTGQGGERSLVKILLLKEGRQSPVLAAVVQMPPTDPMMLPYDKMQVTAGFVTSGN